MLLHDRELHKKISNQEKDLLFFTEYEYNGWKNKRQNIETVSL